jgi:uncharacterized protein YjbI with pentapeptide repeats
MADLDLSGLDLSDLDVGGVDLSGMEELDLSGLDLSDLDAPEEKEMDLDMGLDLSGLDLSDLDMGQPDDYSAFRLGVTNLAESFIGFGTEADAAIRMMSGEYTRAYFCAS